MTGTGVGGALNRYKVIVLNFLPILHHSKIVPTTLTYVAHYSQFMPQIWAQNHASLTYTVQSILLPFEHSQTMKFTQQHKLIGLAFHSICGYCTQIVATH